MWVVIAALGLSLLGHLVLYFGIPFLTLSTGTEIPEDLIIKTELRVEPPKKIQTSKTPQKKPSQANQNQSLEEDPNALNAGPLTVDSLTAGTNQEGGADQKGAPFRLPQSAIIYYDSFLDGQQFQAGQIDWEVIGNNYRLYINIPYAFVGPFVFESRGTVDAYGIAPSIYWSQRGTRNPRYSRFDRNEKGGGQMYFSEKPEFTPEIIPGTQDRFSLMFQLASLLNGDNKIDEAGSIRSIPVVDYNTLEMWQFKSYGEAITEDVPNLGKTTIRHYALMQRESNPYKRQVDIWLAKDLEWLPGRIRSQESNGRVLELVFKQKASIN